MQEDPPSTDATVIVGGGFGGLTAALSLAKSVPRGPITLIEPRDRFLFQPLLYELLSGELQSWEVAPRYNRLLSHHGINTKDGSQLTLFLQDVPAGVQRCFVLAHYTVIARLSKLGMDVMA